MNKHLDQSELSKIIAAQKGIDPKIAETFIQQLFKGVEKELIDNKSVKIDRLGTFKIIKSGSSNRILFLGSAAKSSRLQTDAGLIGINSSIDKPIEKHPQLSIAEDNYSKAGILTTREEKVKEEVPPITLKEEEVNIPENIDIPENKQIENKAEQGISDTQVSTVEKETVEEVKSDIAEPALAEPAITEDSEPIQKSLSQEKEPIQPEEKPKEKPTPTIERPTQQRTNSTDNDDPYRYISERERTSDENDDLPVKKRSTLERMITEVVVIFIIVSIGFFIYSYFFSTKESEPDLDKFTELDNNDKTNYSCIILSDTDISVQQLAKAYYGNKAFWPYIYKANENIVNSSFIIPNGSIIKIPKLTVDIVSFHKGELNDKAKALEEEIMNDKDQ